MIKNNQDHNRKCLEIIQKACSPTNKEPEKNNEKSEEQPSTDDKGLGEEE